MSLGRRAALAGLLGGLAGCMGTYVREPERVHLCRAEAAHGWDTSGHQERDGVTYHVKFTDSGSEPEVTGPIPQVYWVGLQGGTAGSAAGRRAPPMLYDPGEAYIDIDGRRVNALPRLWTAGDVGGLSAAVQALSPPADLNDPAHRTWRGYYIAFPMRPPAKDARYVISPGTILLDGQRVTLPRQLSCHEDARTRYSPLR